MVGEIFHFEFNPVSFSSRGRFSIDMVSTAEKSVQLFVQVTAASKQAALVAAVQENRI